MRQVHTNHGGTGATGITSHPVPAENPTLLPLMSSLSASLLLLDELLAVISVRIKRGDAGTGDNSVPTRLSPAPQVTILCPRAQGFFAGEGSFFRPEEQAGRVASGDWNVYQRHIKRCPLG